MENTLMILKPFVAMKKMAFCGKYYEKVQVFDPIVMKVLHQGEVRHCGKGHEEPPSRGAEVRALGRRRIQRPWR